MNCERCNKRLSRKTARLIDGKMLCSTCMFAPREMRHSPDRAETAQQAPFTSGAVPPSGGIRPDTMMATPAGEVAELIERLNTAANLADAEETRYGKMLRQAADALSVMEEMAEALRPFGRRFSHKALSNPAVPDDYRPAIASPMKDYRRASDALTRFDTIRGRKDNG